MSTHTPQQPQEPNKRQVLEDKLKLHITREFNLGEKVITLLKQNKELETGLQQQLTAKAELEQRLQEMETSKQKLEQQFRQTQQDLRKQQKTLRRRSRRIVETEEGSREDLHTLRLKIGHLKAQLDLLDTQKVEEHVQLTNTIKELTEKESLLKQELQKIAYQKEVVEEDLQHAVQKLHSFSKTHSDQHKQYEKQIESLHHERAALETRIGQLMKDKQQNERVLEQEIASLKMSNAQLEQKVASLSQQQIETPPDFDANLLQVIEKQDHFIRELKDRAHQRSAMLRAENELLRKEFENMATSQKQILEEKETLESSLQGLQSDLAEYIHLQNKVDEVQREKAHFEATFRKKLGLVDASPPEPAREDRGAAQAAPAEARQRQRRAPQEARTEASEQTGTILRSYSINMYDLLREVWNTPYTRFLLAGFVAILIALGIIAYMLTFPGSPSVKQSGRLQTQGTPYQAPTAVPAQSRRTPQQVQKHAQSRAPTPAITQPATETPPPRATTAAPPAPHQSSPQPAARDIVVQLADPQAGRFAPKQHTPFPTIEDNIVLRRHYEHRY